MRAPGVSPSVVLSALLGVAAFFVSPCPAGADISIKGDFKVPAYDMVRLIVDGLPEGLDLKKSVKWRVEALPGPAGTPVLKARNILQYTNHLGFVGPPGTYRVYLRVVDFKREILEDLVQDIEVGGAVPVPPPGPGPGPGPNPTPAPIPLPGLRALIVYESLEVGKLPRTQAAVLYAKAVREYLDAKTPLGPDGKTHEWRIYDKDVNLAAEGKTWQDAMARAKTKMAEWKQPVGPDGRPAGPAQALPWIIISNGTTGYEGPLPLTVKDTLELLARYAQ